MSKGAQLVVVILLGLAAVGAGLAIGATRRRPPAQLARGTGVLAPPARPADILDDDENIPPREDVERPAQEPLELIPLVPLDPREGSTSADRLMRPSYGKKLTSFLASAAGAPSDDVVDAGSAPTFQAPAPLAVVDAGPAPVADAGPAAATPAGIVSEQISRAPLRVTLADDLSLWLKLIAVDVYIDGRRVLRERNDEGIVRTDRARVAEAMVFPGKHQVRVELGYVGRGGLFAYMEAYKIRLREVSTVDVPEGGAAPVTVNATAFDRGAIEEWEKRPGLRISVESPAPGGASSPRP